MCEVLVSGNFRERFELKKNLKKKKYLTKFKKHF